MLKGRCKIERAVGYHCDRPVFVSESEPAAGRVMLDGAVFSGHILIVDLLQSPTEIADQAFKKNVDAGDMRRPLALNMGIGIECDRCAGAIFHFLLDREEVVVLGRKGAGKDQARSIVPGNRHRLAR